MRISDKPRRFLEVSANIAILVVAIILVQNLIWSRRLPKQEMEGPKVGNALSLPGINWTGGNTVVLVLQKGCRFCEESAAFYRRLHEQRSGSQPRIVAAVPGEKTEISRYLSDQGVVVDEIVNAPLSDINVSYTPTLLLVDRFGKVSGVWVGKIDARNETEVIQRILNSP